MSRGREGPARFLGQFEGILQTDDYIVSVWSNTRLTVSGKRV